MARKIQFKRGLKANLPKLSPAEMAFTTDEKKAYIGDGNENIRLLDQKDKTEITTQLADTAKKSDLLDKATKDYVTEKIVEVNTGGTVDISTKASITYVDQLNGINNYATKPTFENGVLTKLEELDGNTIVKRTTMTYNSDGTIGTVKDEIKGKTVISTFAYDNGVFSSISKQLIEGGL